MNFSYVFKALIMSFFVFILIFTVSFVSSQNDVLTNSNYGIKDSVKESIDIANYRISGDIKFDEKQLINSVIKNYVKNNNIKSDEVSFKIYVNENTNIVTVQIYSKKNLMSAESNADYTFSYRVVER